MNYYTEIKTKLLDNEIYEKVKDYSKERHRIITYFEIGRLLHEAGKHYGENVIKKYSEKLTKELGKKYSERNLLKMRQFYIVFSDPKIYTVYTKLQNTLTLSAKLEQKNVINTDIINNIKHKDTTLSANLEDRNELKVEPSYLPDIANLTWSHYTELISIKDINKMIYYLKLSAEQKLDVRSLRHKIKYKEYERLDENAKSKIIHNTDLNIKEAEGIELCGSEKLYYKLIVDFATSSMDNVCTIMKYLNTGDIKNYTILVHGLKSNAKVLGIKSLGNMFEDLEMNGKAENTTYLFEQTPKVITEYRMLSEHIKQIMPKEEKTSYPVEKIKAYLNELLKAVEDCDIDTADAISKELTKGIKDTLAEQLKVIVLNMDADKLKDFIANTTF